MTKLDAVDLQNKELNDLYDFEYNRRFPESEDSIPTQFVRGLSRELSDPNSYANKGGSFADGLGEGFVQGATDGYLREADKHKHEGMGDIYDIIADIKLQTQKLKADAMNDQAAVNEKTKAIRQLAPSIRQLSEAKYAGDTNAEHDIGRGIFEMMKSMGMATGNYITTRDGTIIGEDENGVESMNINDLISQSGLSPEELFGDDAGNMMGMLSKGSKAKYEQAQAMSQAELDEKYAKADNLNAQADKYNAEAGKIGYEMHAPKPKYDDTTLTHIRKTNSDWVNELNKKHRDANKAIKAQIQMRDAIQAEKDQGTWQTGTSIFAQATRWANEKVGDTKTKQLLELKRQPLFKDLKNTFGTRITDNDLAMWLTTQVDLTTDPDLAIEVLNERIEDTKLEMNEELIRRRVLENKFQNSEPYNSLPVDQAVHKELGTQPERYNGSGGQDKKAVMMKNPQDGSTRLVPVDQVQMWEQKGAVVVNE